MQTTSAERPSLSEHSRSMARPRHADLSLWSYWSLLLPQKSNNRCTIPSLVPRKHKRYWGKHVQLFVDHSQCANMTIPLEIRPANHHSSFCLCPIAAMNAHPYGDPSKLLTLVDCVDQNVLFRSSRTYEKLQDICVKINGLGTVPPTGTGTSLTSWEGPLMNRAWCCSVQRNSF